MRIVLLITFAFLLLLCPAQNSQVEEVQQKVNEIVQAKDSLMRLKKIETAAAYYYIYYAGRQVKLIESMQMDEGLEKKVDWFFDESGLLFTETLWLRASGTVVHSEKAYLHDAHLIYLETDKVEKSEAELPGIERNLLNYANRIRREAEDMQPPD